MAELPHYRIRLFLSVDLVGSTEFKTRSGDGLADGQAYPAWATEIRKFFSEFPVMLSSSFIKRSSPDFSLYRPKTWKTLGDEIIFCVNLVSRTHAFVCIDSFLTALRSYGQALDAGETRLDVKGCAWIAAFPTPNVSVQALKRLDIEQVDQIGEELERGADQDPTQFDFLGPSIDLGFRIAKHSSSSLCALSVDLALIIAEHCHDVADSNTLSFTYKGYVELKGVSNGKPYPIVLLEAERDAVRREVVSRELTMRGVAAPQPIHVRDFAHSYMREAGIEKPALDGQQLPASYARFAKRWNDDVENDNRAKLTLGGEGDRVDVGSSDVLPAEIREAADAALSLAREADH